MFKQGRYADLAGLCNQALERLFQEESGMYPIIKDAMRYSLFAGGKRLRAVLLLESFSLFCDDLDKAMPFACAIEMIHGYSLIHDDLPAMDNDDYRRGNPTCHKVFGEAHAILTGDALLNFAYETMIAACLGFDNEQQKSALLAMKTIAKSAGVKGMIAGQAADIENEKKIQKSEQALYFIQTHKTGALIEAAVLGGAQLAFARAKDLHALSVYASQLGLAFQTSDDILDVEGDDNEVGKTLGKDEASDKLTAVSLFGIEKARALLRGEVDQAIRALLPFGEKAQLLKEIAQSNLVRRV